MAEHMTDPHPDRIVPEALESLLDAVLDDDQAAGGRTRPPVLVAAAFACALIAAVLAGSVGIPFADAAALEVAAGP